MIALVTGGTGYIGSNLIRHLLANKYSVHVVIRKNSIISAGVNNKKICYHIHDGTTEGLIKIVSISKPDIVFHLASEVIYAHKSSDIQKLINSNILFGVQLVEAIIEKKIFSLVNISTFWKYFNNDDYNPVNLYAATKKAYEDILKYYIEANSLSVINLILYDVYGPNDNRNKLLSVLLEAISSGKILSLTPGEQMMDLVYIGDVVHAITLAGDRLITDKIKGFVEYTVSSNNPICLKELVNILQRLTNKTIKIKWGGEKYRERQVFIPWNGGETLPGWFPLYTLEEGLKKIL